MGKWWQDPRLDDEGTYDYYAEELPKDYAKWELSKHKWRCDNCGKYRHLMFTSAHYFYCWDGWDSMHWNDCWRCRLKDNLRSMRWRWQKRIKTFKMAIKLKKSGHDYTFKYWYKLAKKI